MGAWRRMTRYEPFFFGGGTAQHTEVCPLEQAEREDFFHGEVAREPAEEIKELAVREGLPTYGEG